MLNGTYFAIRKRCGIKSRCNLRIFLVPEANCVLRSFVHELDYSKSVNFKREFLWGSDFFPRFLSDKKAKLYLIAAFIKLNVVEVVEKSVLADQPVPSLL